MSIKLKSGMGGSRGGRGRTEKTATLKGESKKRRRAAGKQESNVDEAPFNPVLLRSCDRVVISLRDGDDPAVVVRAGGRDRLFDSPAAAASALFELQAGQVEIYLSSSVHFAETECTSPWLRAFARQLNGET